MPDYLVLSRCILNLDLTNI